MMEHLAPDNWDVEKPLKPLKLTCTSSNCKVKLHSFSPTPSQVEQGEVGQCRSCDEPAPFDWERLRKMDPNDLDYTINALKTEMIRHHYWNNIIPLKVENYARRKGIRKMEEAIVHRIRKYIGSPAGKFDWQHTPMEDSPGVNAVNFAQHATASCCRNCAGYWFGIPVNRDLTETEISYLTKLGMRYVAERFPLLEENGEKVPPIRSKTKTSKKTENVNQ